MVNSTKRRGQTMAIFLLLGIVLIAVVGFMLLLRGGMEGTGVEDATDLGLSTTSFKAHAHQCLRREVLNAVDKYGLIDGQGPYIGAYVRKNLPKCIEWDFYEEQGFAITAGKPEVKVEIAPDTLLVDVEYPIEGEDERGAFSFEELYYYLPRGSSGQLRFDGADRTKEEVSVSSSDGDAELVIPEGTVVKGADGNPVEKVELRVLERDFNGLANPLIVGMVAYEITPHVTFSNPVTLKMTYREQDIPSGVAESTLRLAQFEWNYNMWFSVPTTVDEEKNTLTASFTHFSPVAPVIRCGEGTYSEFPSSESWRIFFSQNCNDRGSAEGVAWDTDEEKNLFEDQNGNIESLVFLPAEKNAETGEYDAGTGPKGQAVGLNQVSLSLCNINDWDSDDQSDTTEQVNSVCIVGGAVADSSLCAEPDKNAMLEECIGMITDIDKIQERIDALEEQERNANREVPSQDGIVDTGGCDYAINEEGGKADIDLPVTAVPATVNTYGYPAVEGIDNPWDLPGGFGVLRFRFAGNGGACIAQDQDGKLMIELGISLVPGEEYGEDLYDFKINPYMGTKDDPEFLKLTPADSGTAAVVEAWENWDTYKGTLEAGDFDVYSSVDGKYFWNEIYVRLDNADGNGALIAALNEFVIHGTGITFDVPHPYEECTVTVQERINYLCGCDGNCNTGQGGVEGEDDWTDSELDTLADWRGEWNPSAGSVVNGQTLLCDLDMADSRITSLRESGWTPFGGYCSDDGPVGMERVVTGGECTTVGMGACDYATNNAVECVEIAQEAAEAGTPEFAATWQVKANGECGEDQVCRIMGGGATCVGETEVPEECSRDCRGGNNFEVLEDGACYECVEQAAGCAGPEVFMAPGEWELRENLNPGSLPICQPYFEICADEVDAGGIIQIERECFDECVGEWGPYPGGDTECTDPRSGPYCCQKTGEGAVEEMAVCPDGGYSRTTATGAALHRLLNECRDWGEGYTCIGDAGSLQTSIYCSQNAAGNWFRCFKACTGATCGADGRCVAGEPGECEGITKCEDLSRPDGMARDDDGTCEDEACWPDYCNSNECVQGCKNYGDYCIPEELYGEIVEERGCLPTADVDESGRGGDVYFDGTDCWRCYDATPEEWGMIACLFNPGLCRMDWRKLGSTYLCGCTEGGKSFDVGETAWFGSNDCRECEGMNTWGPLASSNACEAGSCGIAVANSKKRVQPGQWVCLGPSQSYDYSKIYIKGCTVKSPGVVEETGPVLCRKGCGTGDIITRESCDCTGSQCPDCPEAGDLPAGNTGQIEWLSGSYIRCWMCEDGSWRDGTSAGVCWCREGGPGTSGTMGDRVWENGCWKCEADSGLGKAVWAELDAGQCPESRCTYSGPSGTISASYEEHICVEREDVPGTYENWQCLGEDSWDEESCPGGCEAGEKNPSTC